MSALRTWLAACFVVGAGCDLGHYEHGTGENPSTGAGGRYHPGDFALSSVHGVEANLQAQDCRGCHGQTLDGGELPGVGAAPACDTCHTPDQPAAWRSDCTFCHGGIDDTTGAPPVNIDGSVAVAAGTFPAHAAHVNAGDVARAFDCVQCHSKATDVLSVGHAFDDTAGRAEVDLASGLSGLGAYDRATGCTTTYCHGSGRADDGSVSAAAGAMTCTSCHPSTASSATDKDRMSGAHRLHLGLSSLTCGECHAGISHDGASVLDPSRHVDGSRDVAFAAAGFTMNRTTMSCTGSCHGRSHQALPWRGGDGTGSFHPAGFSAGGVHGPEMELQRMDCRGCHGSTLDGDSGPSCDSCHSAAQPAAWRSDCTFCHGGDDNATGAPPRDLGAAAASASLSFRSHTAHIATRLTAPLACTECHTQPADVLSTGHAFDATPGTAEVRLAAGRSPQGTYSAGTCSNTYCHGNGVTRGTATDGASLGTCASCHPSRPTTGEHGGPHRGYGCTECHRSVAASSTTLASPTLHIDGLKQVSFAATGMTWNAGTRRCSGECHGEDHESEEW